MKNTQQQAVKKRRPANLNTFTFEFTVKEKEDGNWERLGMVQSFKGQKALIEGDTITPWGFAILTGCLADNIMQLAAIAKAQGFDAIRLIENAGKRLGLVIPPSEPKEQPKERAKKGAKIIGITQPKIIGV